MIFLYIDKVLEITAADSEAEWKKNIFCLLEANPHWGDTLLGPEGVAWIEVSLYTHNDLL